MKAEVFEEEIIKELRGLRQVQEEQVRLAKQPRVLAYVAGGLLILTFVATAFGVYDRLVTNKRIENLEMRTELRETMDRIAQINLQRAEAAQDMARLQMIQSGTNSIRYSLAKRAAEILKSPSLDAPANEYLFVSENLMEFSDFEAAFEIGTLAFEKARGKVEQLSTRNQLALLYYRSPEHRDIQKARSLYGGSIEQIAASDRQGRAGNFQSTYQQWIQNELVYGECEMAQTLVDRLHETVSQAESISEQWEVNLRFWILQQNRDQERCELRQI